MSCIRVSGHKPKCISISGHKPKCISISSNINDDLDGSSTIGVERDTYSVGGSDVVFEMLYDTEKGLEKTVLINETNYVLDGCDGDEAIGVVSQIGYSSGDMRYMYFFIERDFHVTKGDDGTCCQIIDDKETLQLVTFTEPFDGTFINGYVNYKSVSEPFNTDCDEDCSGSSESCVNVFQSIFDSYPELTQKSKIIIDMRNGTITII